MLVIMLNDIILHCYLTEDLLSYTTYKLILIIQTNNNNDKFNTTPGKIYNYEIIV